MQDNEASGIISAALASRATYDQMAAKEAAVWGRQAQSPQRAAIVKKDQEAAVRLGLNDRNFSFGVWCRASGRTFNRGLSVGCGGGRAERQFMKLGICKSFHGVDIAADAVETATAQAKEESLDCTYEVADVNFADFGTAEYDLVIAQTSLHHVVHLEDVFAAIDRAAKPGALFWLNDFVGESQFQYSDKRLGIVNSVLREIPEEFRLNQLNNTVIGPIARRKPGTLISPFEAIRSEEILPIARSLFDEVAGRVTTSILHLVCPVGTRSHYVKNDESVALFRTIKSLDEILIENRVLDGTSAGIVFAKREGSH